MQKERLVKLIKAYQEHFSQYKKAEYNETEIRNDYVNPFFEILGWDVNNKKNLSQHLREVKHEASVYVEEEGSMKKKKPDYAFNLGTQVEFFLETKKPSVDIMTNADPAFQIRRYGWNGNLKASVLTNFTDLAIYDCSIRPQEGDDVSKARVAHYHYTEYVEKYDEIASLLSREAVLSGYFERFFSEVTSPVKKEPFDQFFLSQIKEWRYRLGQDIYAHSNDLDEDSLNIFVQRIINRIVFLRICEDRNLEIYESLKSVQTYDELKKIFATAEQKYDSGLFDLIDEKNITISNDLLISIFVDLYYPNSCYEFNVVDPYIIGQIYELFLEEKMIIDNGTIELVKKPEIVDSQGVVNTPKNMTDIIVQKTLSKLYISCNEEKIDTYRIADICCGSGNFLLSAYEYIINYKIEQLLSKKDKALAAGLIYDTGNCNYELSFSEKRKILVNNIYGVDIDPLAVEVTKFSLLIKLIEGTSRDELQNFTSESHSKILPNIDSNIRNGNSLVGFEYLQLDKEFYNKPELFPKLRLFDWAREFDGKRFDAIIGNPPYIRVQNMVHYSNEEYLFYKSNVSGYITADTDLLDKYYLFIERALKLLNTNGVLGYIVPHKFMVLKTGKNLRKMLSDRRCVSQIIHFGTNQVFRGKSTYTCLLFLTESTQKTFQIEFVKNLQHFYANDTSLLQTYEESYLSETPWNFLSEDIVSTIVKLGDKCKPLDSFVDIFVGLQTSADTTYILKIDHEDEKYAYFFDKEGHEQVIEKEILYPCIYDVQLTKYQEIIPNCKIIFPYQNKDGKVKLYTHDEMKERYPKCLAYLETFKAELNERSIQKRDETNWYQYGRSQSIKRFASGEHLIWAVLSTKGNYVYDQSQITFTGGGNGPFYGIEKKNGTKLSLFYLQALLNHWLLERIVKSKASTFRGDYYSHGKQFIAKLPIYDINFGDPIEKDIYDNIVLKVKNMMQLMEQKRSMKTKEQREMINRMIFEEEKSLNSIIDKLYGAEGLMQEELDEE